MKVLQINAVYGFKSTGVIVKDIADTLVRNGDEPYVAYQKTNEKIENGYAIARLEMARCSRPYFWETWVCQRRRDEKAFKMGG